MELFEHIRRDKREGGASIRGLARRHRVPPAHGATGAEVGAAAAAQAGIPVGAAARCAPRDDR